MPKTVADTNAERPICSYSGMDPMACSCGRHAPAFNAFDVCECGDYRSQHRFGQCQICKDRNAPWDHCSSFRKVRRG